MSHKLHVERHGRPELIDSLIQLLQRISIRRNTPTYVIQWIH